jgi:hypothetical protein
LASEQRLPATALPKVPTRFRIRGLGLGLGLRLRLRGRLLYNLRLRFWRAEKTGDWTEKPTH